ncbi:MAG TPA: SMC-Scp complex subunit ScpB [Gammaproteobacteria bacterium]|nr:SMC-Scp complex subunit ScpB [Gammaproteobacteria bacterium]
MENEQLKLIIEAMLLAAGRPLNIDQMLVMFEEHEKPGRDAIREAVALLQADYEGRGIALVEVGGGYRIQVRETMQAWVGRLWEEKPARYSRALLETLALIAYRQPITRGEIEEVRGVTVSTNIMKTLQEREWVQVVGHRDVPGRPAMYGTTRQFLNYFSLKNLDELPSLAELRDLNAIGRELQLDLSEIPGLLVESADAGEGAETDAVNDAEAVEAAPVNEASEGESGATLH